MIEDYFEDKELNDDRGCKDLFLPVTSEVYEWYENGGKQWEIRTYGRFNERTVFKGRVVWVSKGYSGDRFLALVCKKPVVGSLDYILDNVPYEEIIPTAKSREDAVNKIKSMIKGDNFVAFNVRELPLLE